MTINEPYLVEENCQPAPWEVIFESPYFDVMLARLDEYAREGRKVRGRNPNNNVCFRPLPNGLT